MSRIIYLKQLPKNFDEEYLIKINKKQPKIILIEDDPKDEEHQFKYKIQSNGAGTDKVKIWEDFASTCWVEYDIFTRKDRGSYFKCSNFQVLCSDYIYFELLEDYKRSNYYSSDLLCDENAVNSILYDVSTTTKEKADNLLTLLLDRQMYLNDSDEFTADQADAVYNNAEYADFFDKVSKIIKELDPELWNANESQITLPTLQDFL